MRQGADAPAAPRYGVGGFTLLELVIAVAILSILAVMAVPVVQLDLQRQKESELRQDLRELRHAIDAYKRAADEGQIARKADASGYPPRLEDLVNGVTNAKDLKARPIYFLRRIPRDPFNQDASLPAAETWGKRSYQSPPDNPTEGDDVFDVYSLSTGTGINGVPYRDW
ncbi:MAG TPA: type II secretion system protein [Burkholderiaceae bacterium]|nr:type II secretion system protein [Burkholderiaceae bacterium]